MQNNVTKIQIYIKVSHFCISFLFVSTFCFKENKNARLAKRTRNWITTFCL